MYLNLKAGDANINYRLITAYLLLQVNCDKIMHARRGVDMASWKFWISVQFNANLTQKSKKLLNLIFKNIIS